MTTERSVTVDADAMSALAVRLTEHATALSGLCADIDTMLADVETATGRGPAAEAFRAAAHPTIAQLRDAARAEVDALSAIRTGLRDGWSALTATEAQSDTALRAT